MSAFFVPVFFALITLPSAFADDNCPAPDISSLENIAVKWVYDGDTVLLTDKRKIRIIGIDTPETRHHKQQGQAYGAKAREALREKLRQDNYRVKLHYEIEKKDKYGRVLAHLFLNDGTNISSWLLQQGYARTLAIPPNVSFAECYRQTEKLAQLKRLNIWKIKKYQLYTADTIGAKTKGYIRLKGLVQKRKNHKNSLIFRLTTKQKKPIEVVIKQKYFPYFQTKNLDKLIGKNIIVSGMLKNKKNKRVIQLNHSSQLEILAGKQTKPRIKWSSP